MHCQAILVTQHVQQFSCMVQLRTFPQLGQGTNYIPLYTAPRGSTFLFLVPCFTFLRSYAYQGHFPIFSIIPDATAILDALTTRTELGIDNDLDWAPKVNTEGNSAVSLFVFAKIQVFCAEHLA
jgi:hypothetical protein